MPDLPLENYALVGDQRTAALIGASGSVDWMCYPRFDSPSIFAALLDHREGGHFSISPDVRGASTRQMYLPDTNIVLTLFMCEEGILEVTDFMPVPNEARLAPDRPFGEGGPPPRLVRRVRAITGSIPVCVNVRPAFDYARARHDVQVHGATATFTTGATADPEHQDLTLHLHASVPLHADDGEVTASFTLHAGHDTNHEAHFQLSSEDHAPDPAELQRDTAEYWRGWIDQCRYTGRWREAVRRSALALKLLTYAPTGAIIAAPTTSLPERPGGERNWDYRYMWPRDAAFTVYALLRLGFTVEAQAFNDFIEARSQEDPPGHLHPVYRIDGGHHMQEVTLDHLRGYRASRPVRVGNLAQSQYQLDVYGELIDALYLYNKYGEPLSYDEWCEVRRMLDFVCERWRDDDDGIWEVRSGRRPHTLSKVMCWVALDRGIRIADDRGLPGDTTRWRAERDIIYEQVMKDGFDRNIGAFTQAYGNQVMDAANLLMPLVLFVGPRDPRWISTLDRIQKELASGPLVYRYRLDQGATDGLHGEEGAFLPCSFWMVECLTRAGRHDEARTMLEQLIAFSGPLGLLSEEIGTDGALLGNYPQALTHLALISAAVRLDRALDGNPPGG